ncbi:hypothetical protein [Candidatus Hecatella orcuttiae]|jgi:hypothetical protein|uniref:hypothetical protein n=1 Tax=Candidatus Hecatella orcuttiae TaxID=1935119 RepID=UPI002867FDAA|nr:hypothetical protein [Candidatus Hecatella orcuttiae]
MTSFYYDHFIPYVQNKVKWDDPLVDTIARVGFSAFTDNPLNLFLKGPSSIGKSYIVKHTLAAFPKKCKWNLGGISPKALIHDPRAVLVDEEGNILEPPTVSKKDGPEAWEEYKSKLKRSRYLIDLKNVILTFLESPSEDTFNMLRPILSHDEVEIEYRIAPRGQSETHTKNIVVKNWPAMICATTDKDYLEDLATRSITVTPNESIEKFAEAHKVTAKKYSMPSLPQEDLEFKAIRDWIAQKIGSGVNVVSPQAEMVAVWFPHNLARDMRDFDKYLSFVIGNCIIHEEDRPKIRINKLWEFTITTLDDFLAIDRFWSQIIKTTRMGISAGAIELYEKVLIPLSEEGINLNTITIRERYSEVFKKPIAPSNLSGKLKELLNLNLIEEATDEADRRRKRYILIDSDKAENVSNYFSNRLVGLFDQDILNMWLDSLKNYFTQKGLCKESFNYEFIYKGDVIKTEFLLKYLNSFNLVQKTNSSLEIKSKNEMKHSEGNLETLQIKTFREAETG